MIFLVIIQIRSSTDVVPNKTPTATSFIFHSLRTVHLQPTGGWWQKLATNPPCELPNHEELGSKTEIITRICQAEMPILGVPTCFTPCFEPCSSQNYGGCKGGGPLQPKVLGCSSQGLEQIFKVACFLPLRVDLT